MLKMRMLSIRSTMEKLQPNTQPGDEVTYNGHYQNTGIFLLKYLDRPDGGKVLNKAKTAYDVIGVPERIQWTESKKYLPIPQDEIEAAKGTLKQNEY